ncbi:hypothetical protein HDF24_22675 [Mucilaginibacter sp. X4EP1]|uniref:hypothetical protein n=1 Tax=Mucilaginibacter sp. X4EP1 TaxID=2723092 RepID=UPI002169B180|nr:hypothetical protein [Mucilaginibacter sp. X4EP1]MCS3816473.1 hypothetical protein [Mucilaginibacter sp. X4EP1]
MAIQDYIESGILEAYVIGAASADEVKELLYLKAQYPEINTALQQLEADMERVAQHMAIKPPPGTWDKIEQEINGLILREDTEADTFEQKRDRGDYKRHKAGSQYIEVEAESTYMRLHKNWKWVFWTVFALAKVFLVCSIYFYLENRQAQENIKELKTELHQLKK